MIIVVTVLVALSISMLWTKIRQIWNFAMQTRDTIIAKQGQELRRAFGMLDLAKNSIEL
jgi:hypothetical protein